jgi:hypothetical protein
MNHGKFISILQYFTDKYQDYWHIIYPINKKKDIDKDKYLYFYDISKKALEYNGEFSKNKIYLFLGYDENYHEYPLEIAQYSLASWLSWRKTKNEKWLKSAMLHCDWLVKNQCMDGAWKMHHKNPKYSSLPDPWPSSLSQGLAVSSLIRAYYYTRDEVYLNTAKKAINFLELPVNNGGVKRTFTIDKIEGFIYEEYPTIKLNGVLNGYISTILSLYEISRLDKSFNDMYLLNINNLTKILPLYDTGYWSYYSLDKNISSGFYHRYVIQQLIAINELSEANYKIQEYISKFINYRDNRINQIHAFIRKLTKI